MKKVVGKVGEELRLHYGKTPEEYRAFAAGFAAGQAEKVYLGACQAAMFRPSNDHFEWYYQEVKRIADAYGLETRVLSSFQMETSHEIWIYREKTVVGMWMMQDINSPEWHQLRAQLCGIPADEVDVNYHLRSGYGEKCD
jgi:hypothetical protein